jgi:hypothetical protein
MQTDLAPAECLFGAGSGSRTPEFIKAVAFIFSDIYLDSTALRAVANLLARNRHDIPATDYYQLSLDLAENEVDKMKTRLKFSDLMIQIAIVATWGEVRRDQAQQAQPGKAKVISEPEPDGEWQGEGDGGDSEDKTDYFEVFKGSYELLLATTSTNPPANDQALLKLFQESLMNQSYCEMKLGLFEKASASFERARSMLPDELLDGGSLTILPSILAVEQNKYQELIEKLHGWNVLELMAWLSQEYQVHGPLAEDPNTTFGRAGHLAGNDEFVTKAYEEIIRFMDQRNMHGARKMRYNLAEFHINVSPDLGKAKRLLYEVCDLQASFLVSKLESCIWTDSCVFAIGLLFTDYMDRIDSRKPRQTRRIWYHGTGGAPVSSSKRISRNPVRAVPLNGYPYRKGRPHGRNEPVTRPTT